jgi:hypothetical protein
MVLRNVGNHPLSHSLIIPEEQIPRQRENLCVCVLTWFQCSEQGTVTGSWVW